MTVAADSLKALPKILRRLGEGGMGEVYLAESPGGTRVALKLLTQVQPEQVALFEGEAQLLVQLRHPAIAGIYGYAADSRALFGTDRGPCFWMEYVEGRGLLEAAREADPARVFAWLKEALEALHALHAQNISHGDISPRNVLVTVAGRLKLLDFGLAGEFGKAGGFTAGTLPYLAPERLQGKNFPSSDLFSLGTLFYEALAGRHPRATSRSLQEMLRAPAAPLLEVAPGLEPRFAVQARALDRMIRLDPKERLGSAREALEALSHAGGSAEAPASAEYHSAKMFGAEGAFAALDRALAEVKVRPVTLWLHGIGGVGKSRFLREAAIRCAVQGLAVREIEAARFGAGLRELAAPGAGGPQALFFRNLDRVAFAELSQLLRLKREGVAPGRLAVFEWNDDRLGEEARRLLEDLPSLLGGEAAALKNLDPAATRELVREALGETAAREIAADLFRRSSGNPRMLLEILRLLRERRADERRHFSRAWTEEIAGLDSFESILAERLEGLAAEDRSLLAALAAAHEPARAEVLAAVCPKLSGLAARLASLCEREFLKFEAGDGKYRLAIPALEPALLRGLPPERLRELHRRWLQALPPDAPHGPQRLRHALALEDGSEIARLALPATEALAMSGRTEEALELAGRARAYLEDPAELSRLLRAKTNWLTALDRYAEALVSAEEVFRLAAPDEPAALKAVKYGIVSGIACLNLGRREEAASRFAQALEAAGDSTDREVQQYRVRAHALLGNYEWEAGRREIAKRHFETGLALPAARGRRRAELCRNLAAALAEEGEVARSDALLEEAKALYREAGHEAGEFATWLEEGNLALRRDDPDRATEAYRRAEVLAEAQRDDLFLARVWNNRAVLERRRGELAAALEHFARAHEILHACGNLEDLAEHLAQYARAEFAVGRLSRAESLLSELRALAPRARAATAALPGAEAYGRWIREGHAAPTEAGPWDAEARLQRLEGEGRESDLIRDLLRRLHEKLPVALQLSFVDRHDWRRWIENKISENAPAPTKERTPMQILESLATISRELLMEDDMDRVLKHLMDAAMRLSGAENGFLVLRSEEEEGPIPGFSVVVARNVGKEALESKEFAFSLSAIREAMEKGQPVVTDNALQDPRFSQAKSVQLHELKSILALPINGRRGVLGVFYLDHRFEAGLFGEEQLQALRAFADQAALALQKAQMIEELKRANAHLTGQVEEQSDQLHRMQMELAESRLKLKYEYSEIVGRSPKMVEVLSLVDKITDSKISVWIFGESGTGKESIARALHFNSGRAKQPFVAENCSALPETLMESELFGHKRGAFTHADKDKKGILEYAHRGTIFLDEIADLSLNLQAKLLRFLQEGEIRPLGSNEVVKVDVRVVSASNKDLQELVEQGKFREDLYFRLNGVTIHLPPLRERMEDLPLLVEHFLKRIAAGEGKEPCRVSMEVLRQFMNYPWPGNIRELQNTLETAALFAENGSIGLKSLAFKPILLGKKKAMKHLMMKTVAKEAMDPELEKLLLAIRDNGYHKGNAAQALGISRRNLYTKLEKFGVPVELKGLKAYIDDKFV